MQQFAEESTEGRFSDAEGAWVALQELADFDRMGPSVEQSDPDISDGQFPQSSVDSLLQQAHALFLQTQQTMQEMQQGLDQMSASLAPCSGQTVVVERLAEPQVEQLATKHHIPDFFQQDGEAYHQAWERFRHLLLDSSHYDIIGDSLPQFFFAALQPHSRDFVQQMSRGEFYTYSTDDAWCFLQDLAEYERACSSEDQLCTFEGDEQCPPPEILQEDVIVESALGVSAMRALFPDIVEQETVDGHGTMAYIEEPDPSPSLQSSLLPAQTPETWDLPAEVGHSFDDADDMYEGQILQDLFTEPEAYLPTFPSQQAEQEEFGTVPSTAEDSLHADCFEEDTQRSSRELCYADDSRGFELCPPPYSPSAVTSTTS